MAIRVLLGTQSVSTAEPPSPSESTTVTSAPSWAATSADSYPPGPPPRITTRSFEPLPVVEPVETISELGDLLGLFADLR